MARAFFFISSGRSGTQWLAKTLATVYSDLAIVEHEPLRARYRGRDFYRLYDRTQDMLRVPAIKQHADDIARVLATGKRYIEAGSPSFAAIPLFLELFPDEVGLVHLTRHPVPASMSLIALIDHLLEGDWSEDDWAAMGLPDPTCPGAFQHELESSWGELSPYRRTLFVWTEMQLYADELHRRYPDTPFLRVSAEELFGGGRAALDRLIAFVGVPAREALFDAQSRRVDAGQHVTMPPGADWREILEMPRTMAVARSLGYDPTDVDAARLQRRGQKGRDSVVSARPFAQAVFPRKEAAVRARFNRALRRIEWRHGKCIPPAKRWAPEAAPVIAALLDGISGFILDVGCGSDPIASLLLGQSRGRSVIGVDRDPRALRLAADRAALMNVRFVGLVADPETLPFKDGTFDGGVCEGAVGWLARGSGLSEVSRVLRRGGRLVLAAPNRARLDVLYARLWERMKRGQKKTPAERDGLDEFGWNELERLARGRLQARRRATTGWSGGWKARVATRLVRYPPFRRVGRTVIVAFEVS